MITPANINAASEQHGSASARRQLDILIGLAPVAAITVYQYGSWARWRCAAVLIMLVCIAAASATGSAIALKTQIWIAICVYVLVAIVKKEMKVERSMSEIRQILSVSLFGIKPILQAFSQDANMTENSEIHKPLLLFN